MMSEQEENKKATLKIYRTNYNKNESSYYEELKFLLTVGPLFWGLLCCMSEAFV